MVDYRQDFAILRDEVATIIGDIVLEASGADRHQEVVVDEVVTAKGDENEGFVHEILCLLCAYQRAHPLLILSEILQLVAYPYNVYLGIKHSTKIHQRTLISNITKNYWR